MPRMSKKDKFQKNLQDLLYETTEYLLEKVRERDIIASDVSNIIKLLKSAGVLEPFDSDEKEGFSIDTPFPIDEDDEDD